MRKNPQIKGTLVSRKYYTVLIVCVVAGFIIGYSYNVSKDDRNSESIASLYTGQGNAYQEDLIEQQERNKELAEELNRLQLTIRGYEQKYTTNEQTYDSLVQEAHKLRLLLGQIPAVGSGLAVTLKDNTFDSLSNPNDYIVHESHIFAVINELKIAGAEAITINGQRLQANSYIYCNGPVITVDGHQYPAPFVIEAVGDGDNLLKALDMAGGVFDQLLADQIVVTMEKKDVIEMPAITKGNT